MSRFYYSLFYYECPQHQTNTTGRGRGLLYTSFYILYLYKLPKRVHIVHYLISSGKHICLQSILRIADADNL
jgi:hypothetical protein